MGFCKFRATVLEYFQWARKLTETVDVEQVITGKLLAEDLLMNIEAFNKHTFILLCLLLSIVTFVAYWQVLHSDFTNYDDPVYITDNSQVKQGLSWKGIKWAFTSGHTGNWHPLTWLSHMLDCELFGLNPHWHHLVNLLIHITNALLLFIVSKKMTGSLWCSFFVAAVFALHPLNVQSVAWVAERKNVLSTMFWFLTMYTYVRYARQPKAGRYLITLLLFALGLMAKPMLVTLPVVLLVLDYWPLCRLQPEKLHEQILYQEHSVEQVPFKAGSFWYLFVEKFPFFILSAVSCLVTFIFQQRGGAVTEVDKLGFSGRLGNAVISYIIYIAKTVLPTKLVAYYPHSFSFPVWQVAGAILLLAMICVLVFLLRRPNLICGWLWYVITLLPVIGLIQVGSQARADRYMYVPMVGLLIMVAWGVSNVAAKYRLQKGVLILLVCICLLTMAVLTWINVGYWHDGYTLFTHTLDVVPDNHIAHLNLANILLKKGDTNKAIEHYQEAVRVSKTFVDAHFNLGVAFFQNEQFDKAIEEHNTVLQLNKNHRKARFHLANALTKSGQLDKAIDCYTVALRDEPENVRILSCLSQVLLKKGQIEDSISLCEKALVLDPNSAQAHYSLACALEEKDLLNEAIKHYEEALILQPNTAEFHYDLGGLLNKLKLYDKAIAHYQKVIELEPGNIMAHGHLGMASANQGYISQAIEQFQIVLKARPDDVEMYCNLGVLFERQGKLEDAIEQYRKAVRINPNDRRAQDFLKSALGK